MARYIDADKLEKDGWMLVRTYSINPQRICHESKSIDEIPHADVRENVRGKWSLVTDRYGINGESVWKCSACSEMTISKGDFCPNCGADMRGEKDGKFSTRN